MSEFELGTIVATAGICAKAEENPAFMDEINGFLKRHSEGDWGDVCADDRELNDETLEAERRGEHTDSLMSVYDLSDGETVWIITEWDRSVTTVLLPEEY